MARSRIMVVDDHEVVRTGLRAILEPEGDLEVVGARRPRQKRPSGSSRSSNPRSS